MAEAAQGCWKGTSHVGMGTTPRPRARSTGAIGGSGLPGTLPTGHRGERKSPFFRHFCPGFVVRPFPASSELWVAQRGARDLGTAQASPQQGLPALAIPFHAQRPSQARNHRIDPESLYPLPRNHRIKSVPLKRTEKCRFPRFGRSSYTHLILPVFPRFPRGALIAQNNPKSLPTGWTLCREPEERGRRRGLRPFPS